VGSLILEFCCCWTTSELSRGDVVFVWVPSVCDIAAQVPSVQVTDYSRLRCSGAKQLYTKRQHCSFNFIVVVGLVPTRIINNYSQYVPIRKNYYYFLTSNQLAVERTSKCLQKVITSQLPIRAHAYYVEAFERNRLLI
jgi:hypothetical protein